MDKKWAEKIKKRLGEEPCSQKELGLLCGSKDRRIISGYLSCLVDLGEIQIKGKGKSKFYFLKDKGDKK